jgi:gluconate 2-dehydrogenase alpha chain
MATKLKPVDVVLVGMGWTGGIMAAELSGAGLTVVGLERGQQRDTNPDWQPATIHNELRYAVRHELMQDVARETITFRNDTKQHALPMRQLGSFLLGSGLGGAGVHWNGQTYRFLPEYFVMRSHIAQRYGAKFIPDDMTIQDWGVTYEELEPYFDKFERVCGVAGKAGNIKGVKQSSGNPFEGPRSGEYPSPPMKSTQSMLMFEAAAKSLGYHPYVQPSANSTQAYTNPYGETLGSCMYCGFCERFGCEVAAKASPQVTVLPTALKSKNFELRLESRVNRILLTPDRRHVTGVTYFDSRGQEFEQPAEMVVLCAYVLNNNHLMMLSGIGGIYDPRTGEGKVGRNYAYQIVSNVAVFFDDIIMNPFMGAGALGMIIDDFQGDVFDHAPYGFIGGGYIGVTPTGGRPIQYRPVPSGTPRWGSAWKKAAAQYYNHSFTINTHGSVMSYRGNYLDLDPTYRDAYGDPLLRMTFDYHENEVNMSNFLTGKAEQIAKAMKPTSMDIHRANVPYSIVPYQTTHNTGGTIMGADPSTSVVNRYLQSWDAPNLFVMGASVYPFNGGYNPTGTVGALTYWAVDAIKNKYLHSPGSLM